jgi:hypothetical protein
VFSYFEKGITDTRTSKFIGFSELVKLIRQNPNRDKIETIRNLRCIADESYKKLKAELPYITPACMVHERNLDGENLEKNLIQLSQYLYFDIDKWNSAGYKEYFINKYGKLASMICISTSGGGVSVLFKLKNPVSASNFKKVWQTFKDTILTEEIVDTKCSDIARAMFISQDEEVYVNYENEVEIEIDDSEELTINKREKQGKTRMNFNNTLISPFSVLPIGKVLESLKTRTEVQVINPVVDFRPEEIIEVYIPKVIKDGTKHRVYASMINALVLLNPNIGKEYIFSYLNYINSRFAKPRMEKREFTRYFNMVYYSIKTSGKPYAEKTIKYIHFNPSCQLPQKEKNLIANVINGYKRRNESIQIINQARKILEDSGQKITQKSLAQVSGLSIKTVRKHFLSEQKDMEQLVAAINNSIPF